MTQLFIKWFIKDYENVTQLDVRHRYGLLGGCVGICVNVLLFISKLIIGFISSSISITADAFNNLSDAGASIVTLIGFKFARKPADDDHPFGHARSEYISALVISFFILFLGAQLVFSSIGKIIEPEVLSMNKYTFIVLAISMVVKLWLFVFNGTLGKKINSSSLKATAQDSLNDVYTTGGILLALLLTSITGIPLDGYIGLVVACFILYSGYDILKETVSPLLGEAPSEELVQLIQHRIESYEGILGLHDLVVHSYGPNRIFASVHVEVDATEDILVSHDLIDTIERDFMLLEGIHLVIHLDPIITDDTVSNTLQKLIQDIVASIDSELSIHDFRAVQGHTHTNLIFDIDVPAQFHLSNKVIAQTINTRLHTAHPDFHCVITFDRNYISTRLNSPS